MSQRQGYEASGERSLRRTATPQAESAVIRGMGPFFFGLQDWWGRWAIDRAGVATGAFTSTDLRSMLESGEVNAHTWLRHIWTQRYSLVGEVLYSNGLASDDEFAAWFPEPERKLIAA